MCPDRTKEDDQRGTGPGLAVNVTQCTRPYSIREEVIIDGILKRYERGDKMSWAHGAGEVST